MLTGFKESLSSLISVTGSNSMSKYIWYEEPKYIYVMSLSHCTHMQITSIWKVCQSENQFMNAIWKIRHFLGAIDWVTQKYAQKM